MEAVFLDSSVKLSGKVTSEKMDTFSFESLRSEQATFPVSESGVYRVHGADHLRYLHNRLTQNIKALSPSMWARSLLLTPNGKIQGLCTVVRRESDVLIFGAGLAGESGGEFVRSLLQFKVADQVEIEDLSSHFSLAVVLGTGAIHFGDAGSSREEAESVVLSAPRLGLLGGEVLSPKGASLSLPPSAGVSFDVVRVLSGEPLFGQDVTEKSSVAELSLEPYVSFQKGCYVGQEVVEMCTARGKASRRFALFQSGGLLAEGEEVLSGESVVGVVTSAVSVNGVSYALGFLKNHSFEELRTKSGEKIHEREPAQVV